MALARQEDEDLRRVIQASIQESDAQEGSRVGVSSGLSEVTKWASPQRARNSSTSPTKIALCQLDIQDYLSPKGTEDGEVLSEERPKATRRAATKPRASRIASKSNLPEKTDDPFTSTQEVARARRVLSYQAGSGFPHLRSSLTR